MHPERIIGEVKDGEMLKMKVSIAKLDKSTIGMKVITIPTCHNLANHHVVKSNGQTTCHILLRGALQQNVMMIRIHNAPTH